ncbi:MAG: molecular chaperone TorD family protein, partial [Planctomycetes bacterium]|nr:molecular chaperone TorD family protein [Planctomycetota bacterium]
MDISPGPSDLRAAIYAALVEALAYPTPGWRGRVARRASQVRSLLGAVGEVPEGFREAARILEEIALRLRRTSLQRAVFEHGVIFGHSVAGPCTPYEAEYGARSEASFAHKIADVAAFYRAFGVVLSPAAAERPDHLAVECEFLHFLACKESRARERGTPEQVETCRRAQREFVRSHLACWAGGFAKRFEQAAEGGALAGLGRAL